MFIKPGLKYEAQVVRLAVYWAFVLLAQQFHWQERQYVVLKVVLNFLTSAEPE